MISFDIGSGAVLTSVQEMFLTYSQNAKRELKPLQC